MTQKRRNKAISQSMAARLAPAWSRFLCFCGDLAVGHLLSYYLLSFDAIAEFERRLTATIAPVANGLGLDELMVGFLLYWYLMTMLFRFGHTFLFGVSFFEKIAGLKSRGQWWWQRLAGGARVMIDTILAPFLIFDLKVAMGKPSFKEELSGCTLERHPKKKGRGLVLLILLPITFFLSISGPLFKDLTLIDGLIVSFEEVEQEDLKPGDNFNRYTNYYSDKFKLKTFSSLDNGRFSIFPDFEFVKVKAKKRLSPYLLIYDHQNKTTGELKVGLKVSLLELIKRGSHGNPLFSRSFPALSEALNEPRQKYERKDFNKSGENRLLLNPMVREDIRKLIQASFQLGQGNLVSHVLSYGPFLRGFVEIRQAFLLLSRPGVRPEVDMITMGNIDFLRFRQTFSEDYPRDKQVVLTYIPIDSHNSFSLQLGWDKSLQGALSAKAFRKSFLANGEWFLDYDNFFKKARLEAEVTPLYALDLIGAQDNKQSTQDILEEFLYRYYYQKCRTAIQKGDKVMLESLRFNIMRLSSIMKIKERGKKNRFSTLFMNQWQELWTSFQARDFQYFNI